MPLTRSKRKSCDDEQIPTKIKSVELVKTNNRESLLRQKSTEQQNPHSQQDLNMKIQNTKNVNIPIAQTNPTQLFTQANPEQAIIMLKTIRKVLSKNFKNVKERLELDVTPNCLFDRKVCIETHNLKSSMMKASGNDSYTARTYLSEDRHYQFFHFVRHFIIGLGQFPGIDVCTQILQTLLSHKSNEVMQFSSVYIVSELYSLFRTIIHKFPPCQLRKEYLSMFLAPFTVVGFNEKKKIIPTVVDLIYDQIFTKERNDINKEKQNIDIDYGNDFNKNFYIWDVKFNEIPKFSKLSREDRLERLFLTLDLLLCILEHDLAIFMVKYSHKFGAATSSNMQKPLICSSVWENHESVVLVNNLIKKVVSVYITMNEMNYPKDKIKIISRFLSLIANIINMYEYTDTKINYPAYKNYTLDLSREIQKQVESSIRYSMNLYIKVIKNFRSSLLRMLLAHHLYTKISGENQQISLSIPFNAIHNRYLDHFSEFEDKEVTNNELYPVHTIKKELKKVKISRNNYLKLLLLYTEAVSSYYQLKNCVIEIKKEVDNREILTQLEDKFALTVFNKNDFLERVKNIDLNEKVLLRDIDIEYSNSIHVQLTKQECFFYRLELRNFLMLRKVVSQSENYLGTVMFNEWMEILRM
ncbi:hypothetical protein PVAND_011664 [Polypedilum vanderplanki]|uniref:Uncharacterized protein n=1 Tax=Polypedilum vanderplanki TaxID=319348 RepID=A0A9J6CK59_POLVA|nr:hypothetical protein PVAND_011664 [Polypedilum vanderplanki]